MFCGRFLRFQNSISAIKKIIGIRRFAGRFGLWPGCQTFDRMRAAKFCQRANREIGDPGESLARRILRSELSRALHDIHVRRGEFVVKREVVWTLWNAVARSICTLILLLAIATRATEAPQTTPASEPQRVRVSYVNGDVRVNRGDGKGPADLGNRRL